jgi:hypothetical protein
MEGSASLEAVGRWPDAMRIPFIGLTIAFVLGVTSAVGAQTRDGVMALLVRVEEALVSGQTDGYLRLLSPSADRDKARAFAEEVMLAGATGAAVRERDRIKGSDDTRLQLVADVLLQRDRRATLSTWSIDVERAAKPSTGASEPAWLIREATRLSKVEGLHRLRLDRRKQFAVRAFRVVAEDVTFQVEEGRAYVAEAEEGLTALVILGRGEMNFTPSPAAEKGQIRIFGGSETLRTRFSRLFVRLSPSDVDQYFKQAALVPEPVHPGTLSRAEEFFEEQIFESFGVDLGDLSRDTWSLLPTIDDVLVDVDTDRWGILTYARNANDPEDISLFDRRRKKTIAIYSSVTRLARRGRAFDAAAEVDYDVYRYDVDATFSPDREWIEGRTGIQLRVRSHALAALTLRLAESLVIRAVVAEGFGRLLTLRVRGQNSFIVNLPTTLSRDDWINLQVFYAGRLPSQSVEREVVQVATQDVENPFYEPEPRIVYSNRSYWYPQSTVGDYALARMRLTVPVRLSVVASGRLASGSPTPVTGGPRDGEPRRTFTFDATQPLRYLSVVISRLNPSASVLVTADRTSNRFVASSAGTDASQPVAPGAYYHTTALTVVSNPRQTPRAQRLANDAARILAFYQSVLGDAPYPGVTLTTVDDRIPGGHSPAYLVVLQQPLMAGNLTWRNDPVNFDSFPEFFLAHELAHQYWGQAVGWQNYHEQWISEGFAQYFAALFAERTRSSNDFTSILHQMRRSVLEYEAQGPIWLGYRLGHLKNDGRAFRAVVYNKGALVLHMLRQLIGDDVFFRGLRALYRDARFRRVGTEDVRRAFETASGRSLERFFQHWVYEDVVPQIAFSTTASQGGATAGATGNGPTSGSTMNLRFEQRGPVFEIPVPVLIEYTSGAREIIVARLSDAVTEIAVPLKGTVKNVRVDPDETTILHLRS